MPLYLPNTGQINEMTPDMGVWITFQGVHG